MLHGARKKAVAVADHLLALPLRVVEEASAAEDGRRIRVQLQSEHVHLVHLSLRLEVDSRSCQTHVRCQLSLHSPARRGPNLLLPGLIVVVEHDAALHILHTPAARPEIPACHYGLVHNLVDCDASPWAVGLLQGRLEVLSVQGLLCIPVQVERHLRLRHRRNLVCSQHDAAPALGGDRACRRGGRGAEEIQGATRLVRVLAAQVVVGRPCTPAHPARGRHPTGTAEALLRPRRGHLWAQVA
mmetsp:Transcript_102513/g.265098  ORF Transcript_102513/g.265098 Transcript_102513/m.265098 type:complete len:242 (-) Transcript_102513:584-1309(-)